MSNESDNAEKKKRRIELKKKEKILMNGKALYAALETLNMGKRNGM